MFCKVLMIIIGFFLLVIGADVLIKGSTNIAKKFHIPEMLIGLTIVALGTSAPELIITITSANKGATDLIIGNAIGSNLCNSLLILGLMAVIIPVEIDKDAKKIHIPIAFFATLLILSMGLGMLGSMPSVINGRDGTILIIMFIFYFSYPIIIEINDIVKTYKQEKNSKKNKEIKIMKSILFIIIGIVLLKYGGDFVVDNSSNIAKMFNVPERIIGLTIVAIGTALPELVTSIFAVIKKDTDLAVGNLVGSCVLNLFLILGVGSIITPLDFANEFNQNLVLLTISTFIIWLFNFIGKKNIITRNKGAILLLIFAIYIIKLFV
ncbi:MAG: calcium/sodium antiporter [Clostridia bacterium]|nr:calcium/sodium antiporter [Clostridia bacterium]